MTSVMDNVPSRSLLPDAADLFTTVCQHLEIQDKQKEALSNFEVYGSVSELALIEKLFSPSDSATQAVIFYKAITNERKLFKIPVTPGSSILQHKLIRKSKGSYITTTSSQASTANLSKHSSDSSVTSLEVLAKVRAPSIDLKSEDLIYEAEQRRSDSPQYLVFARTYTRVKIHVRAAPLTDQEAHKLGVERCVCVVRRADPDVPFKDDILPITSLFEFIIVLYPILPNCNDLISKIQKSVEI
ncbi:unnamed protein product [Rodentolepis nana]|uniref:UBX domain-containing protein n=1 Tax=Rodentolepis nana TaxID=102285 RepID=A0A0R3T0E2_RODNA|nr:unnamed protein product [Rodentolepis nana]